MAKIEQTGAAELFPELPPDRSEAESKTRERAVEYLTSHIMSLLSTHREIRPIDDIATFYGDMLGIARTKHAREAIKALHARGAISDNGVKEFWLRSLRATTS